MPGPRAVLFDLDGVLVDSIAAWEGLLRDAIAHFGGRPFSTAEFRELFGQSTAADCEVFLPGVTPGELDDFYCEHFAVRAGLVSVAPGVFEAIAALRRWDLGLGVVTNAPGALARQVLTAARLLDRFDTVVGADEVAAPKPAPDMMIEAARRLGVVPGRAVVVGDSRYDIAAARAAGAALAIGVGSVDCADHVIDSLMELPPIVRVWAGIAG